MVDLISTSNFSVLGTLVSAFVTCQCTQQFDDVKVAISPFVCSSGDLGVT